MTNHTDLVKKGIMPKIYSETEKKNIRDALRREAGKCLHQYGVRKTTVDELVRRVAIPKGTFYLFYPSKEALFFDLLESFYAETEETYPEMLQEIDENHIVTSLTDIFYTIIMRFYHAGLYWFLDGAELELVLRRLPEGTMERITKIESNVIHELFSYFAIEDEDDIRAFTASYDALFHLLLEAESIPEMEKALRFLIRGLVLQMVE